MDFNRYLAKGVNWALISTTMAALAVPGNAKGGWESGRNISDESFPEKREVLARFLDVFRRRDGDHCTTEYFFDGITSDERFLDSKKRT